MSVDQAFLDDILADPEDDAPRLIYADWLEENGDPDRAEFIRVQCRLARMDEDDPERLALRDREAELLQQHEEEWRGGVVSSPRGPFERGFVAEMRFWDGQCFLQALDECTLLGPWYRLHLYRVNEGDVGKLIRRRELARLTSLALRGGGPEGARRVAGCRWLKRLQRLDLLDAQIEDDGARALARSRHLGNLTHLGLNFCSLGPAGVAAILNSPRFPRLNSLDLSCNDLDGDSIEVLARSPRLGQMQTLGLAGLLLAGEGLYRLIESGRLGQLARLDLADTGLEGQRVGEGGGAEILSAASGLDSLVELQLEANGLCARHIEALGRSPALERLRELNLSENPLENAGAVALAQSGWRLLRRLDLTRCDITDAGLIALANSPVLATVRRLVLWDNIIGPEGATALARSGYVTNLVELKLTNGIGPEGARALAASTTLRRLEDLDLSHNDIGDTGAAALALGASVPSLRVLGLHNNGIGAKGALALAESSHLARLHFLDLTLNAIEPDIAEVLRARFGRRVLL